MPLAKQINHNTILTFINKHLEERERGEGLLMISTDESGVASAYYDIQFWPQWAACELGGAVRSDRQNTGQGGAGTTGIVVNPPNHRQPKFLPGIN